MLLVDNKLKEYFPYLDLVNPASINLTLSNKIRVPRWYWTWPLRRLAHKLDLPKWSEQKTFERHLLMPGKFVLLSTKEITRIPDNCGAWLFLRSTYGRLGLEHSHAAFGDPGFNGPWTLELSHIAPWPITLSAGDSVVQMIVFSSDSYPDQTYNVTGRYQNQRGPTPAKGI